MFNLLVARDPQAWESPTCRMRASRFCEFSESYSLDDETTLRLVEQLPTLLVYEAATKSSTAHLVRHGVIHSLRLEHHDLVFEFVVDSDRGFLPRSVLREFADRIGVHRHEPYRTHWAVKPGDLPEELLVKAGPRPPPRNVPKVYAAYRDAVKMKAVAKTRELTEEIAAFPPSEDKGVEYLQTVLPQSVCLAALPLLGIRPKSPESRAIVDRVIAGQDAVFDPYPDLGQGSRPLLLAPFYSRYGGPTEVGRFEEAIDECIIIASELESNYRTRQKGLRSIAYVVWQSARHPILAKHLRRRLAGLVDRMMLDRTTRATWIGSKGKSDLLATAMIAVGMQRLGDDKHRAAVCETIRSLCQKQHEPGGLPAFAAGTTGDVLATTLLLEAVQRSGFADDLAHVLERGENWVMHQQKPSGAWRSLGWPDASITAFVLDYFQSRSTMLPQVDGFLLMARDFFKKAMDLKAERGANNRRLATIAAVHSLEMFLYGVFERAPDLGVSAYRDKGDETLGPRAALSELQSALRRTGVLNNKQAMSHRDQVIALIRHRDNIIHHASEISEEELIRGVRAVRRFITIYGVEVTGLDLLQ